jgi:site-specific recombinase XerD
MEGLRFVILFHFYFTLFFTSDFQYFITAGKDSYLYLYLGKHYLDRQSDRQNRQIMFLPIKPICDRRSRRDGTSNILIQYCFSSERRTVLNTEMAIPPTCWNKRLLRINPDLPTTFGDYKQMNFRLQKMLRIAEDIVSFALQEKIDDSLTFLKNVFHPAFDPSTLPEKYRTIKLENARQTAVNLEFFYQLDDYIKSKSRKVSIAVLRNYTVLKNRLLAFQKHQRFKITFESFDYNFYEGFVNYLTYDHVHMRRTVRLRGLKRNSIGASIKQLRIFLQDRVRRKIIPSLELSDYKILDEETDAIYLSSEEIQTIYNLDLSEHPEWIRFRDLFVLGCFTGLRFSDFSVIKPEDIRNGTLYKKQEKADHWVVIPLRPEAHDILVNRFRKEVPKISNPELNRYIKKVGQLAGIVMPIKISHKRGNQDVETVRPKYELITTHTCRRSFCTNEFLAGTPPELIMKISGHKSLKDFYKYIRISPEEAANQIRNIWEKRGEMEPK